MNSTIEPEAASGYRLQQLARLRSRHNEVVDRLIAARERGASEAEMTALAFEAGQTMRAYYVARKEYGYGLRNA